jgi:hypothetical protein
VFLFSILFFSLVLKCLLSLSKLLKMNLNNAGTSSILTAISIDQSLTCFSFQRRRLKMRFVLMQNRMDRFKQKTKFRSDSFFSSFATVAHPPFWGFPFDGNGMDEKQFLVRQSGFVVQNFIFTWNYKCRCCCIFQTSVCNLLMQYQIVKNEPIVVLANTIYLNHFICIKAGLQ